MTAGLPLEDPEHHVALASFCADVLDLCANINGSRVNIKIGLNSGPVTAGIIGETRRFYRCVLDPSPRPEHPRDTVPVCRARARIFGDTVNVASRMMSTGELNRVHCSGSTANALLLAGEAAHGLRVSFRGQTFVKGKGNMDTYWVERSLAEEEVTVSVSQVPRVRRVSLSRSSAAQAAASMMSELDPRRAAALLNSILRADAPAAGGSHVGGAAALRDNASPHLHLSASAAGPLMAGGVPPLRRVPVNTDASLFSVSPRVLLARTFASPDNAVLHVDAHTAVDFSATEAARAFSAPRPITGASVLLASDARSAFGSKTDAALPRVPARSVTSAGAMHPFPSQSTADWAARLDASAWKPLGVSSAAAASAADSYLSRVVDSTPRPPLSGRRAEGATSTQSHEDTDDVAASTERVPPPTIDVAMPLATIPEGGAVLASEVDETLTADVQSTSDAKERSQQGFTPPRHPAALSPHLRLPPLKPRFTASDVDSPNGSKPGRVVASLPAPLLGQTPKGEPAVLPSSVARRFSGVHDAHRRSDEVFTPPLELAAPTVELSPSLQASAVPSPVPSPSGSPVMTAGTRTQSSDAPPNRLQYLRQKRLSAANLLLSAGITPTAGGESPKRQTFRFKETAGSATPPVSSEDVAVVDGSFVLSPHGKRAFFAASSNALASTSQRRIDITGAGGTGLVPRRKSFLRLPVQPTSSVATSSGASSGPSSPPQQSSPAAAAQSALSLSRRHSSVVADTSQEGAAQSRSSPSSLPRRHSAVADVPRGATDISDSAARVARRDLTLPPPLALGFSEPPPSRRFSLPNGNQLLDRVRVARSNSARTNQSVKSIDLADVVEATPDAMEPFKQADLAHDIGANDVPGSGAPSSASPSAARLQTSPLQGSANRLEPEPFAVAIEGDAVAPETLINTLTDGARSLALSLFFIPPFLDTKLEAEACSRLDSQSVDATLAAVVAVALLCVFSAIAWLFCVSGAVPLLRRASACASAKLRPRSFSCAAHGYFKLARSRPDSRTPLRSVRNCCVASSPQQFVSDLPAHVAHPRCCCCVGRRCCLCWSRRRVAAAVVDRCHPRSMGRPQQ